jgi:ATP phosphoribosyltransferase
LQEPAFKFFADCGLPLSVGGASREYSATLKEIPGVRIALMQASEIPERLLSGDVHLGLTGEDVLSEQVGAVPGDERQNHAPLTALKLGFGHARLCVAVPMAWLDVATMGDLADVASRFFRTHRKRLRVATKYERLTRVFFARAQIGDYRIVPSAGATEAAPAAGLAEVIVDITTTGATLAANHLKTLRNGEIIASEAALFVSAATSVHWSKEAVTTLKQLLDRMDARRSASGLSVIEAALPAPKGKLERDEAALLTQHRGRLEALGCQGIEAFARVMTARRSQAGAMTKLRAECPEASVYRVAAYLQSQGASEVRVQALDFVFRAEGSTFSRVAAELPLPKS